MAADQQHHCALTASGTTRRRAAANSAAARQPPRVLSGLPPPPCPLAVMSSLDPPSLFLSSSYSASSALEGEADSDEEEIGSNAWQPRVRAEATHEPSSILRKNTNAAEGDDNATAVAAKAKPAGTAAVSSTRTCGCKYSDR